MTAEIEEEHKKERAAAIAVVDEFCAEHEAVEVDFDPADPNTTPDDDRIWYANLRPDGDRPVVIQTIIVPRTVPTLLEAAEAHRASADALYIIAQVPEGVSQTYVRTTQALAAAIKRERSR